MDTQNTGEEVERVAGQDQVESSAQSQDSEAARQADSLRSTVGAWIGSADTKATALLAVSGALLAVVSLISSFSGPTAFSGLSKVFFVLFCLCDMGSIICSSVVMYPRTKRHNILFASKWINPLPYSLSFFGDLAALDYKSFVSALTDTGVNRRRDSIEQAYVLAYIAKQKMDWMSKSVIAIVLGLTFLGCFVVLEAYLSLTSRPAEQSAATSGTAANQHAAQSSTATSGPDATQPAARPITATSGLTAQNATTESAAHAHPGTATSGTVGQPAAKRPASTEPASIATTGSATQPERNREGNSGRK